MKSSEGRHYAGLDHIRALAAFLVVAWHFSHGYDGTPVPFNQAPALGVFDEGHVGVSLFMTLSGYLFAKLIDGRRVAPGPFLWNRALRLLPLLLIVLAVTISNNDSPLSKDIEDLASGLVTPSLPANGSWSMTVEAHFYIVLPFLLLAVAKDRKAPLSFVAAAILIRLAILPLERSLIDFSYWTIGGRIDQFLFGIFFFYHRDAVTGRIAIAGLAGLVGFYAWFDAAGGFYNLSARLEWLWVFIPTLEGAAIGALIAWYDERPFRPDSRVMKIVQRAGEYSYSTYLLHFFFVFEAASFVHLRIMDISSLPIALPWALVFHLAMLPLGYLSFRYIEMPPMKFRRRYLLLQSEDRKRSGGPELGARGV